MTSKTLLGLFMAVGFLLTACSQITSQEKVAQPAPVSSDGDLITDRPQTKQPGLVMVKLSQLPLLSSAKMVDGKRVLDEEHRAALLAEQEEFEKQVTALSPDIQVVYRYQLVMNGMALVAPPELEDQIEQLAGVMAVEATQEFAPPTSLAATSNKDVANINSRNSVTFVGGNQVQENLTVVDENGETIPVDGQDVRVGIIDTGIDYTHIMLGGAGTKEAYEAIDPKAPSDAFPNQKVVGGIDLVGTDFNAADADWQKRIPQPDNNPIDEAGHGTHVAGTVGGLGDGQNTYSGVAPGADLYAIKVFGAGGSTNDYVVIAALEYAADPNGDGNLEDQLDVVNLSLGGGYGKPYILYREALETLSQGGTFVVAAAGNSGHVDNIVGAPSTADAAISVAASVDYSEHNWRFPAVRFRTPNHSEILAKAIEGPISTPISEAGNVSGSLVYAGLGTDPVTDELKAKLTGKVALIDRGEISFTQKLAMAKAAGAVGVVIANNQPGEPLIMGGETSIDLPAIMITQDLGKILKEEIKAGETIIEFQTSEVVESPEVIDTLTDFSSKGPRSLDSAIKPEIAAPGFQVLSAAMGTGNGGVKLNGTSMAAPHVAGAAALLRQYRSQLDSSQLKSLLVASAKPINDAEGKIYPVSLQGGGRMDVFNAATLPVVFEPSTLSLGEVTVDNRKMIRRHVTVTNTTDQELTLGVTSQPRQGLSIQGPGQVTLAAGESQSLTFSITVTAPDADTHHQEFDGFISFTSVDETLAQLPVLAVANRISNIEAKSLLVHSTSISDATGAAADLTLSNSSQNAGDALIFNLLGRDTRKARGETTRESHMSLTCDLESAGYRVVKAKTEEGEKLMLQVAMKLYKPVTNWEHCQVSVQIDADGDGILDQELGGIHGTRLAGVGLPAYFSLLLDAKKMKEIRQAYELAIGKNPNVELNYRDAVVDAQSMKVYNHSTLAVIQADITKLAKTAEGDLRLKAAVLNEEADVVESDDYLSNHAKSWHTIRLNPQASAYYGMPEIVTIPAQSEMTVPLTHGEDQRSLVVYMPQNAFVMSDTGNDRQSQVKRPEFAY